MTPSERERILSHLTETRENLLRTTRGLSPTQLQYKPAPDRWSVAECLEHIIVVEELVLGNINKTLQQAAGTPTPAMTDDQVSTTVVDRSFHAQAPPHIVPTGRWTPDRLRGEFEAARRRTADFVAATDVQIRQHAFPHPIFGNLDCYQWLLLVAGHGERHRAQAEEVMARPGFPRASAAH